MGAAPVADLDEQHSRVHTAVVPPLVEVRRVRVDEGVAAGVGQQLVDTCGIGEAAHRLRVQAQPATDVGAGGSIGEQLLDLGVAFPGAGSLRCPIHWCG
jgi:hypothetical protein